MGLPEVADAVRARVATGDLDAGPFGHGGAARVAQFVQEDAQPFLVRQLRRVGVGAESFELLAEGGVRGFEVLPFAAGGVFHAHAARQTVVGGGCAGEFPVAETDLVDQVCGEQGSFHTDRGTRREVIGGESRHLEPPGRLTYT